DLMRIPASVPLKVQSSTVISDTPPAVGLPIDTPWPLPYVQRRMCTSDVPPPQVKLSSPTLTSQSSMSTCEPETSHASALWLGLTGSVEAGARMITPRTVTFVECPLIAI